MLLNNRYQYNPQTDFIADGTAAKVYKALDTQQNKEVVVKFYHTLSLEYDLFKTNMAKIKALQHPNLVQLFDFFEMESINQMGQLVPVRVGVWEYVSNNAQPTLNEQSAETAIREALNALNYLHSNNSYHLDLQNTDNCLFETATNTLKINNFEITNNGTGNTEADLVAFGNLLDTWQKKYNLQRKVYSVLAEKATKTELKSVEALEYLLNNYERQQLFNAVLPLTQLQFESRYALNKQTDQIHEGERSNGYLAHDNLTNKPARLAIYHTQHNNLQAFDEVLHHDYDHIFKVDLRQDNGNLETCLVGVAYFEIPTKTTVAIEGRETASIASNLVASAAATSEAILENAKHAAHNAKDKLEHAYDNAKKLTPDHLKDAAANAKDKLEHAYDNAKDKVSEVAEKLTPDHLKDAAANAKDKLEHAYDNAKDKVSEVAEKLTPDNLKHTAHNAKDKLEHAYDNAKDKVSEVAEKLTPDHLKDAAANAKDKLADLYENATDKLDNALETDSLADELREKLENISEKGTSVFERIKEKIKEKLTSTDDLEEETKLTSTGSHPQNQNDNEDDDDLAVIDLSKKGSDDIENEDIKPTEMIKKEALSDVLKDLESLKNKIKKD